MDLLSPPTPLTRDQRRIAIAVAVICAASRFLAMARTLWDWDEALFCLGMRSYDVSQHHPHPPGFPTYIAIGHLFRFLIHDDFRALQAVNLVSGMLLFPAMFLLVRELRLRFDVGVIAATLCAFFPNVWFFGGTAFSDVPSIVLVVFAIALLLRGCRDRRAYLLGAVVLAVAIGMRPQNLLIGLWPGFLATRERWRERKLDVALAALAGVVISGGAFAGAAIATGSWQQFIGAVRAHSDYISRIDSFHNPARPPLWRISDRFFLKQYQSPVLSALTSLFVVISAAGAIRRRDARIGTIALAFAPFAITAWLMLDRFSISRFSIGYCPLFAILAADGIGRISGARQRIAAAIGGVLIAAFIVYAYPGVSIARREISPTVAAARAVREHLDPRRDQLYVAFAMQPFVEYLLPEWTTWTRVIDERGMPLVSGARGWLIAEIDRTTPSGSFVFSRRRSPLWDIARRHYFITAVEPLPGSATFLTGWYPPEQSGPVQTRWMGARSKTLLPAARGRTVLRLVFDIPSELTSAGPQITVTLNGRVLETWRMTDPQASRDYEVDPAPDGQPNVLELGIDRTLNPAHEHLSDDDRELGIRLDMLGWGTA